MVMRALESLQVGTLDITLPNGSTQRFVGHATEPHQQQPHHAQLHLYDWSVLSVVAARGDIGFGETYMQGLWTTPDLAALLRLVAANRHAMSQMIYGRWWSTLADQIRHLLRANRKKQARKNISAHYDLGNDFYRLWLDPSMTYSSALFDTTGQWGQAIDLQAGQHRKIDRAISQLKIDANNPQARVLEIGCGWGGLARRLLDQNACGYVGLTLSAEQQQWARQLLGNAQTNGQPRADVRLEDYRDVSEQFDGIVSIEMFEAVGERYWETYFKAVARCLKPRGRAVIQTITIDERLFHRYRTGTDFIQRYIFPGGMLPSQSVFERHAQAAGLVVDDAFFFGQDYARTLAEWMKTFDARTTDIEAQGFDARFQRMWRFYLAYCEAGFTEGNIDVGQFTLRHKGN
jgi:cyclopropane-fatty-acyl-phospholipid synthase